MDYRELNATFKKINKWYEKKNKVLTVKSRPFNTQMIFSEIIKKSLDSNKKVLYLVCAEEDESLFTIKKEYEKYLEKKLVSNIVFKNIDRLSEIKENFDLVIFDDISIFSKCSKCLLREKIEEVYWRAIKIIIYTVEFMFPVGEKIEIPYLINNKPMVEPRIITTRLKLEENIPTVLHEYYKWFKIKRRNVVILLPSENKVEEIFLHYNNYFKQELITSAKFSKNQNFSDVKKLINKSDNGIFIVTSNIGQYIKEIKNLEIVVLFSDDNKYEYKKLLYLCAALNFNEKVKTPELICISRGISENMEILKTITRKFNQKLWEKSVEKTSKIL